MTQTEILDKQWELICLICEANNQQSPDDNYGNWFKKITPELIENKDFWSTQIVDCILIAIDLERNFVENNRAFLQQFIDEAQTDSLPIRAAIRFEALKLYL